MARAPSSPRRLLLLALALALAACGGASEQPAQQSAQPGSIDLAAAVDIPGRAGWSITARLDASEGAWSLDGCPTQERAACEESFSIALDAAARAELERMLADLRAMPRCEPEGFVPGDPSYSLRTGGVTYDGHLAADPAAVAARLEGPCAAPARLAWWVVARFADR